MATSNERWTYFAVSVLLLLLPLLIQNVEGQMRGRSLTNEQVKPFIPEKLKVLGRAQTQKGCMVAHPPDSYVMMEDGCSGLYCSPFGETMAVSDVNCKRKREVKDTYITKKKPF